MRPDLESVAIDELGRVVLSDELLDGIDVTLDTFAGGGNPYCPGTSNSSCSNSICNGSSNTACNNLLSCVEAQNYRCPKPNEVPTE